MSILIIAPPTDDHAVPVMAELKKRGEKVYLFDLSELPQKASISVSFEPGEDLKAYVGRAAEGSFDLDEIDTIWLRRIGYPNPPQVRDRGFAISECHHMLVGLGQVLRNKRWVNPLSALALDGGWGKLRQLQAARKVGLEIPRTLATNDPKEAREFLDSLGGADAIFKPFSCIEANGKALFTTRLDEALKGKLDSLAAAPGILQEEIPKAADLRVAIFGQEIHACAIFSQENAASQVDFRKQCYTLRREKHELPEDLKRRLLALHRELGLVYSSTDIILTPDGRYVWIEANQAGQALRVAEAPGVSLVGPFCDLLTASQSHALPLARLAG